MPASLAETLHDRLKEAAEPARAGAMQAYMKSDMPYLGVSTVPMRNVCKAAFAGLAWPDGAAWRKDVLAIWRGARFREERYAAIELTGVRAARAFQDMDALAMYEEMIVDGRWWDYVDAIAGHRLGAILQNDRSAMKSAMLGWSRDEDMWKLGPSRICVDRSGRDPALRRGE
jgi:3-methyladenine DNA glycosylase AlkD